MNQQEFGGQGPRQYHGAVMHRFQRLRDDGHNRNDAVDFKAILERCFNIDSVNGEAFAEDFEAMLRIIDQRKPRVNLIVDEDESRRFHFTKRTFMRSLKTLFPPGRSGRSGARIKYGSAEDKLETNALNLLIHAEQQNIIQRVNCSGSESASDSELQNAVREIFLNEEPRKPENMVKRGVARLSVFGSIWKSARFFSLMTEAYNAFNAANGVMLLPTTVVSPLTLLSWGLGSVGMHFLQSYMKERGYDAKLGDIAAYLKRSFKWVTSPSIGEDDVYFCENHIVTAVRKTTKLFKESASMGTFIGIGDLEAPDCHIKFPETLDTIFKAFDQPLINPLDKVLVTAAIAKHFRGTWILFDVHGDNDGHHYTETWVQLKPDGRQYRPWSLEDVQTLAKCRGGSAQQKDFVEMFAIYARAADANGDFVLREFYRRCHHVTESHVQLAQVEEMGIAMRAVRLRQILAPMIAEYKRQFCIHREGEMYHLEQKADEDANNIPRARVNRRIPRARDNNQPRNVASAFDGGANVTPRAVAGAINGGVKVVPRAVPGAINAGAEVAPQVVAGINAGAKAAPRVVVGNDGVANAHANAVGDAGKAIVAPLPLALVRAQQDREDVPPPAYPADSPVGVPNGVAIGANPGSPIVGLDRLALANGGAPNAGDFGLDRENPAGENDAENAGEDAAAAENAVVAASPAGSDGSFVQDAFRRLRNLWAVPENAPGALQNGIPGNANGAQQNGDRVSNIGQKSSSIHGANAARLDGANARNNPQRARNLNDNPNAQHGDNAMNTPQHARNANGQRGDNPSSAVNNGIQLHSANGLGPPARNAAPVPQANGLPLMSSADLAAAARHGRQQEGAGAAARGRQQEGAGAARDLSGVQRVAYAFHNPLTPSLLPSPISVPYKLPPGPLSDMCRPPTPGGLDVPMSDAEAPKRSVRGKKRKNVQVSADVSDEESISEKLSTELSTMNMHMKMFMMQNTKQLAMISETMKRIADEGRDTKRQRLNSGEARGVAADPVAAAVNDSSDNPMFSRDGDEKMGDGNQSSDEQPESPSLDMPHPQPLLQPQQSPHVVTPMSEAANSPDAQSPPGIPMPQPQSPLGIPMSQASALPGGSPFSFQLQASPAQSPFAIDGGLDGMPGL